MQSLSNYTSMPSLVSTASKPNQQMTNLNTVNSNLFLEMSKTAQLLSNQLLQLHQNLCFSSNMDKAIDFTPISSGYNSLNISNESLQMSSLIKTSSRVSLLNDTVTSEANQYGIKRRLFSTTSDTSSSSFNESSLKTPRTPRTANQQQTEKQKQTPKTPHKSKTAPTPTIPRIKSIRKKKKTLSSFDSFKLRRAYQKSNKDTPNV